MPRRLRRITIGAKNEVVYPRAGEMQTRTTLRDVNLLRVTNVESLAKLRSGRIVLAVVAAESLPVIVLVLVVVGYGAARSYASGWIDECNSKGVKAELRELHPRPGLVRILVLEPSHRVRI